MNILVVRTDKLGDFITALPTMYVLKAYNPQNRIIACVAPLNLDLAKSCDFIDEVIVDDSKCSILSLAQEIKMHNIDASITLFSNTRVAFAQFLAKIPKRIAPATKLAQIFYTKRVKQRRSEVKMAEFEYNLALTTELFSDISLEYKKPLFEFEDRENIYKAFCENNKINKKVMAFHIGFGGSSDANWTPAEYEVLIRAVLKENRYQIVLTFGPDEKDLFEEMQSRLSDENVVFYLSVDGLLFFAKLVASFKLFVSTSTGTYHIASSVGCPTMTFFGDSLFASASRWKSIGEKEKQVHYMLPQDSIKRSEVFKDVKEKLILF